MIRWYHPIALVICVAVGMTDAYGQVKAAPSITESMAMKGTARPPSDRADLKRWLQNMIWYHRYTDDEIAVATGLSRQQILAAESDLNITRDNAPNRATNSPLLMLPYPGGKHPRIGFLDGALQPQRETKISIFTPWDPTSYLVIDVPEAIWSNLGLTYLAHTHIDTVWSAKNIKLPQQEWQREPDGSLKSERKLPNGIVFGTQTKSHRDHVQMEMWLTNGSEETLTDLRVQNCVMLRFAKGFNNQTNDNKITRDSYVACKDATGKKWLITSWEPNHRAWSNSPCPCLHSDPKFPDCPPGETKRLRGWFSFYQGSDIESEINRIESTNWKSRAFLHTEN